MLSSENYDIVKLHKIIQILSEENGTPDLTYHLKVWARNKNHIYKLFGNELKIQRTVESQLSNSDIEKIIYDFLESIRSNVELSLVYTFLKDKLANGGHDEISQNYLKDSQTYFGIKFNEGMKISRILPKLTTKKWSEWIQIEYSKIVQSFTIRGTAVLSIDPIDYITMSQNSSGWRSCHALDGEYRTGTLAYMMDTCSVVAYVTTKNSRYDWGNNEKIEFSDKIWRQMVLINLNEERSYSIQSRQYPHSNITNGATISNMLIELMNQYTSNNYHMVKEPIGVLQAVVEDSDNHYLWYNDIVRGSFTKGRAIIPTAFVNLKDFYTNAEVETVYVGWDTIPCACGCRNDLEEGEHIYNESRYSDYDDDEEDYE